MGLIAFLPSAAVLHLRPDDDTASPRPATPAVAP